MYSNLLVSCCSLKIAHAVWLFTRIIIWHSYIINLNSWSKNDSIKSTLSFIFYILIVRQIVKSVSQLFLLLRLVVFNLQTSRWNKFGDWYILKRISLTIVLEKNKNMFRFKKFELKQYVQKMVLSDSGSRKKYTLSLFMPPLRVEIILKRANISAK